MPYEPMYFAIGETVILPSGRVSPLPGGSRPGKKAALRTWLTTPEADLYFSDQWAGKVTGVEPWLAGPLDSGRDFVLKNHQIVDLPSQLGRITTSPAQEQEGDLGNALGVLVEFECESLLPQVDGLFSRMKGQ